MLIKACLNGTRRPSEHPALPVAPEALARDARSVVEAGAGALHVHPRGPDGAESLDAAAIGAAVAAIRDGCPGIPVGVSTGAWIERDVDRRLTLIRSWSALPQGARPDFASVNLSEEGAEAVCATLLDIGVDIEAGLWSPEDARLLVERGLADRCLRLLIEIVRARDEETARRTAQAIERVLDEAGVDTPRLLHGGGAVAWPMLRYALAQGYDSRIGLEDTLVLPDGTPARDNEELVATALQHAQR